MISTFVQQNGRTACVHELEPGLLEPDSGATVWVDLSAPTPEESRILSDVFRFHELAVEDAMHETHHPKIEAYGNTLYLILHGIDFQASQHVFATHDVDFFLGANYLVTVHDGTSRSIEKLRDVCNRTSHLLTEGPAALMHRIVDSMIDNYSPEVEKLEERLRDVEREVFERPRRSVIKSILGLKRDVSSLRRVVLPQRDIVARLSRREFPHINEQLSYRFRDVHDHLVRLTDEAMFLQDRLTGVLDAHLAAVSNRLNEIVKVLALITTVLMPMTLITSMFGMNVELPRFPGSDTVQFWWIVGIMVGIFVSLLVSFKRARWL